MNKRLSGSGPGIEAAPAASGKWSESPELPTPRAGVDEAGRGCLAGDVVAAAVILDPRQSIAGLDDSKKLGPAQREACLERILAACLGFATARASPEEIDRLNILRASLLAMRRCVEQLLPQPAFVQVDGNVCPEWRYACQAVVGGDGRIREIAAASIIAKVTRDREMAALDRLYPGYGFARHKGYPTREHLKALAQYGPTPIHRRSFAPVAASGRRALDIRES